MIHRNLWPCVCNFLLYVCVLPTILHSWSTTPGDPTSEYNPGSPLSATSEWQPWLPSFLWLLLPPHWPMHAAAIFFTDHVPVGPTTRPSLKCSVCTTLSTLSTCGNSLLRISGSAFGPHRWNLQMTWGSVKNPSFAPPSGRSSGP